MNMLPFEIRVEERRLRDLQERLARTRWPDAISKDWEYGTSLPYLRQLTDYWQSSYNWKEQEERLNSFPNYLAEIDGTRIHFLHLRSSRQRAVPLIITHGWPGSFLEMLGMLPFLSERFHVVVPSLPGFGFSGPTTAQNIHPRKIAALWAKLMSGLGYERFFTQGGDWGATVSTWLALDAPDRVAGVHLNYIPGSYKPFLPQLQKEWEYGTTIPQLDGSATLTSVEQKFLQEKENWVQDEGGYGHIQGTKPQTVAFGLNDSPVGLAAWIVEKIRGWSDCDGNVENRFSKDEILTNIQLYWLTETIHSSMRIYYEARKMPLQLQPEQRIHVPCAVARFPKEAPMPPREWVERGYHVVRWTEMAAGAHFGAWEEPQLLANDIIEFVAGL